MISPLDYILNGAKSILDKGKDAFNDAVNGTGSFKPDSGLGIARNTVLGLPEARNKVVDAIVPKSLQAKSTQQLAQDIYDQDVMKNRPANYNPIYDSVIGKQSPKATPLTDITKLLTPKQQVKLATTKGTDLAMGFVGGESGSISDLAKQKIARSINPTEISGILRKEVPNLAQKDADILAQGFVHLDNVPDVERALNKVNFKVNSPKTPTIQDNVASIMETGKPLDTLPTRTGRVQNPYKDSGNLTTKTLKKLEGRTTVSKQFISDLTNAPDLKQAERDVIRQVLSQYDDVADPLVKEAKKYKSAEEFVKAQGTPVYHGTPGEFVGDIKAKTFFTNDKSYAQGIGGKNLIEAVVPMKNPFIYDAGGKFATGKLNEIIKKE